MTSRRAIARLLGHPVTWLLVLIAIFFYKEVFLGRIFSPADLLFQFPPWSSQQPAGFVRPSNPTRVDEVFIFFPRRLQLAHDISRHGLVLWQDHNFAGTPNTFAINFLGALVYPPMWAYLVFPPGVANTLLHIPIPLIAALCMYLLLGRLTVWRSVRLLGAIAWGLNGYFVVWLSAFFLPLTLAVLPLLMYLAMRYLDERAWWAGIGYALLLAWTFFLGYPPANVIVVVLLAIFCICWLTSDASRRLAPLLRLAGFSLLALGIAALPVITGITEFSRLVGNRSVLTILPIKDLQTFLFPNVFGNPVAGDWRAPQGNYDEYVAYFGAVPLMLAIAGGVTALVRRDARVPLVVSAVVTGVVSLLLAYNVWPASLIQHVPVVGDISPSRWHIGVVFAAIVLAVFAADRLLSRQLPGWALASSLGIICGAALLFVVIHRRDLVGADAFIRNDEFLRVGIIVVSAILLLSLLRRTSSWIAMALVVVLSVDLWTFGANFNPTIKASEFYPSTPAIRYLQANVGAYRVLVARRAGLLWPGDALSVYGIDCITGYDHFRDTAFVDLLAANMSPDERAFWGQTGYLTLGQALDLTDPAFDELSVRYAFYPDESTSSTLPTPEHWQVVYQGQDGRILENLDVLPRQFVVPASGSAGIPIVHVAARPDRDAFLASGPGRLVWSRPYGADWTVSIDGKLVRASPLRGYFLSVPLAVGEHQVAIEYRPSAELLAAIISAAALMLTVASGLWLRLRVRSPQSAAVMTAAGMS